MIPWIRKVFLGDYGDVHSNVWIGYTAYVIRNYFTLMIYKELSVYDDDPIWVRRYGARLIRPAISDTVDWFVSGVAFITLFIISTILAAFILVLFSFQFVRLVVYILKAIL